MNQCPRGPETNNKEEFCVSAWPLGCQSCVMKCDSGIVCCLVTLQKVRRKSSLNFRIQRARKSKICIYLYCNEMKSWPSIQQISAWINVRFFPFSIAYMKYLHWLQLQGLHLVFFFFKERVYIVVLYWAASSHMCGLSIRDGPKEYFSSHCNSWRCY